MYKFVSDVLKGSLSWAEAGHIPAYQPVVQSQAYRELTPQIHYANAADIIAYDPESWFSGSGSDWQTYFAENVQNVLLGRDKAATGWDAFVAPHQHTSLPAQPGLTGHHRATKESLMSSSSNVPPDRRAHGNAPSRPARPGYPSRRSRDNLTGWAFAAPFLVFFLVFLVWPILYGFYMSLTGKSLTGANDSLIGLANYAEALADAGMWRSLGNTLYFTVISTVPLVIVALVMAALLNVGLPAQWLWRLSYFAPYLLASTVVSLFFTWMYNPQLGLINDFLSKIGLPKVAWLNDPNVAMWAIVIATLWWTVGFNFLLYLAAMQNIPAPALRGSVAGRCRSLAAVLLHHPAAAGAHHRDDRAPPDPGVPEDL